MGNIADLHNVIKCKSNPCTKTDRGWQKKVYQNKNEVSFYFNGLYLDYCKHQSYGDARSENTRPFEEL